MLAGPAPHLVTRESALFSQLTGTYLQRESYICMVSKFEAGFREFAGNEKWERALRLHHTMSLHNIINTALPMLTVLVARQSTKSTPKRGI